MVTTKTKTKTFVESYCSRFRRSGDPLTNAVRVLLQSCRFMPQYEILLEPRGVPEFFLSLFNELRFVNAAYSNSDEALSRSALHAELADWSFVHKEMSEEKVFFGSTQFQLLQIISKFMATIIMR